MIFMNSYNDKLTIYDKRSIKKPLFRQEVGGGVWRIKHHPKQPNLIATACMRTGFKILQFNETGKIKAVDI